MNDTFAAFFDTSGFMPHGMCYLWQPGVLWLNVGADGLIALAYFTIPLTLLFFARRRRDLPVPALFALFAAFILLCGTTHLISIWTVWHPDYQLQGTVKLLTGLVSAATAFILLKVTPHLLALRSPAILASLVDERTHLLTETNQRLQRALTEQQQTVEELKALQQDLNQAHQAANAANLAKSEFLANMSHEIRTPLSAILGYAEVLATQLHDADNLSSIDTIRRNGRYLSELLNDILDVSKIEAGKLDIEIETCTPVDIVNDLHSLMAVQAQEKGLVLVVEYAGPLPATIRTDPVRLRQILLNLVGNAIKFTDHGEVRLRVGLMTGKSTVPGAGAQLQFVVADTGIGMSAPQLAIIFDAFRQADTSTVRRFGGTGLGLTISRQLADLLGGEINVTSQKNAGSTFTLTLALGDLADVALIDPPPLRAMVPDVKPLPRLDGYRVLVVDDRSDIRLLVQRLIEEAGGVTRSAANGHAALAHVDQTVADGEPFDAIVMDMQMPVMDGFEATRRLRAGGFQQPIIALTAGAMLGEREKCLGAGCSAYLSKPVESHRLLELVAGQRPSPPPHDEAATQLHRDDTQKTAQGTSHHRILIVDDSESAATALAQLLSHYGFSVETAFNGRSGLQKAAACAPRTVILDLNLPDMSGIEVLATLRSQPALAQTRFIALSGESLSAPLPQHAQFDHQLLKPVVVTDLLRLLHADQAL